MGFHWTVFGNQLLQEQICILITIWSAKFLYILYKIRNELLLCGFLLDHNYISCRVNRLEGKYTLVLW